MSFWVERNRGGSFWARVDGPYPKIDLARARLDEMRRVDGNMFDYRIAQNFAETIAQGTQDWYIAECARREREAA